jgi:hypothetical protein
MVSISAFNGPLDDHHIAEWLSDCEDTFENYLSEDSARRLTDKQKIYAAGHSLSRSAPTDKLASWYTENRKRLEDQDWDSFRDAVKDKVLGSGWRLRALKSLYTVAQGTKSLDEYFRALESSRFVISRSSLLNEVEDFEYKCLVLFRARPSLAAQVLKHDLNDYSFLNADVDEVKDHLRQYESGGSIHDGGSGPSVTTLDSLNELSSGGAWILSRSYGYNIGGTMYSDLTHANFPESDTLITIRHVTKVIVFFNNDNHWPQITGFDIFWSNGSTVRSPPEVKNGVVGSSLNLSSGEYITSVKLTRRSDLYGIASIEFRTNKGQVLTAGVPQSESITYKTPEGYRVVGFHGAANHSVAVGTSWRYVNPRLGVIWAPLAAS